MDLSGIYPPIPTPFVEAGRALDLDGARRNARRWMTTRLRGLVVLGSNGEAPLVDDTEADRLVAAVRDEVPPDRWLIVGTGRESTAATVEACRRAAAAGADAVLVRTPGYFKPQMTEAVFLRHFTEVADSSPVPVLLYNFTALTGVTLPVPVVARLSEHPNVVGMKESGSDLAYVSALIDASAPRLQLLVGSAPTFFASLVSGAVGGILALACVAPEPCVRIHDAVVAGRIDEARRLQREVTPLAQLVTRSHGVPGLKAALDLLGYAGGPPRPPLLPVDSEALPALAAALMALGLPVEPGTRVAPDG